MDPKEFKKLYDRKQAQKAADSEADTAAREKAAADQNRRAAEGQQAIEGVVLPYLKRVSHELGQEAMTFAPIRTTDGKTIGARFTIGEARTYSIELKGAVVQVSYNDPKKSGLDSIVPVFVFSPKREPFIGSIEDLKPDNLDMLMKIAIEDN